MAARTCLLLACLLYAAPAVALPDLRVELLFATEENNNCLSQVHYTIQVLNIGDEPVDGFDMHIFFHSPQQPTIEDAPDWPGEYIEVDQFLDTWDMFQMETFWQKLPDGLDPGSFSAWLLLDPYEKIPDADLSNNVEGPVYYQVNTQMCHPANLRIDDLDIKVVDTDVSCSVNITNDSGEEIPIPFQIDLYYDRTIMPGYDEPGDETLEVEYLGPGESLVWETAREDVAVGPYSAFAVVDGTNTVIETTEADNVFGPVDYEVCPPEGCPEPVVEESMAELVGGEEATVDLVTEPDIQKAEIIAELVEPETVALDAAFVELGPEIQEAKASSGCSHATVPSPLPLLLVVLLVAGLRLARRTGTLGRLKSRSFLC
jgi:hypothetical protein